MATWISFRHFKPLAISQSANFAADGFSLFTSDSGALSGFTPFTLKRIPASKPTEDSAAHRR
jgi:hypothetical protein